MILGENISKVYNNGKDIQKVYSYGKLVWEKQSSEDIDYSTTPFTVKAIADNVSVKLSGDIGLTVGYKYSINGGGWIKTYTSATINIKKGDTVSFKGTKIYRCKIEGLSDIYGNILSLQYDDNFIGETVWLVDNNGYGYFELSDIRNAQNLILPPTTLTESCYYEMFKDCTSLTTAPELPATTLARDCYNSMFYNCTNLTTAPELPATTLLDGCYSDMFYNCTNLTTPPELPATRLKSACYQSMFYNCTNLTTAPELPATTLSFGCYYEMFYNCRNLNYIKCYAPYVIDEYIHHFAKGAAPTGKLVCYEEVADAFRQYIPSGWTVEYID